MKKIYFVRHGESEYNVKSLIQHHAVDLTNDGLKQAEFVARRFKNIPIDIIVSSPMLRTQKTAEIISKKIGKKIVFEKSFEERKRPTEFEGLHYEDENWLKVDKQIKENFNDPRWRYSDEENHHDLVKRATNAIKFLEEREEGNILVVTHGMILKYIIATMVFKEKLTDEIFIPFYKFFKTKNTGITLVTYDDGKWVLLTWNDHAHLGEVSNNL